VTTQISLTVSLGIVAATLHLPLFFPVTLAVFSTAAFISATHDIAADGFYLLALTPDHQSGFVGIRSTFYRLAMIFGNGFIVWLAGKLQETNSNIAFTWSVSLSVAAGVYMVLALYHRTILPYPAADGLPASPEAVQKNPFVEAFSSYFTQNKIGIIIAFILLYRFGEAFLVKLASPFLLDQPSVGGLGLTTAQVGIVYGTIGVGSLLTGGITGGVVIKKFGLRKCLWPMALIINMPMYVYIFLSQVQPGIFITAPCIALEQFSYGFGFAAYMVYLMFVSRGRYKTSHYAISTGLMALGMMLPGFVSGYLQKLLGYQHFFILTAFLGIPGIITLFFIPLPEDEQQQAK
jgi:PAT family beta-lactamase induction signal transducer AmpG